MRFSSLVRSEFWILKRNKRMALFIALMLAMAALWAVDNRQNPSALFPTMSMILMTYTGIWQMTAISLAEEKERRTLEALLMTPAQPLEIIGAKAFTGVVLATALSATTLLFFGQAPRAPLVLLVGFLLCLLFATASGALVGIVARDIKTSAIYRTPVLALLVGATSYPWQGVDSLLGDVMYWLPTRPVQELLWGGWTGAPVPIFRHSLVMLAYILLVLSLSARILRQQATAR